MLWCMYIIDTFQHLGDAECVKPNLCTHTQSTSLSEASGHFFGELKLQVSMNMMASFVLAMGHIQMLGGGVFRRLHNLLTNYARQIFLLGVEQIVKGLICCSTP